MKEQYNFTVTPEWLNKLRVASVRLNDGGSGAFVSEDGLVEALFLETGNLRAARLQRVVRRLARTCPLRQSIQTAAGEQIGRARFAAYGKNASPDATFTLRLTYGTVKGFPMNGTRAPAMTTFYGLYDRAYGFGLKPPYDLPERYLARKAKINLGTPFNFVSTGDITGGNSGSPVVNRNGDLVGVVFDGNIESLAGTYVYDGTKNRTIAVHAAAVLEALRSLYDAAPLADVLQGKLRTVATQ